MSTLAVRPALPQDEIFLYELYAAVRAPEFELAQISAAQREQIIRMQFRAQMSAYSHMYPNSCCHVVLLDGKPAGPAVGCAWRWRIAAGGPRHPSGAAKQRYRNGADSAGAAGSREGQASPSLLDIPFQSGFSAFPSAPGLLHRARGPDALLHGMAASAASVTAQRMTMCRWPPSSRA